MGCSRGRNNPSMSFIGYFLAGILLLSQSAVVPVLSAGELEQGQTQIAEEKTYYTPAPGGWDVNGAHHGTGTPRSTGGSGGYYHSPPSNGGHSGGGSHSPPSTGGGSIPLLPPPTDPGSPFVFGTCGWWIGHPSAIYGLLGYNMGSVGGIFGAICTPIFGHDLTIPEALGNSRPDGLGALFREGTACFLNSIAYGRHFPFTTDDVKDSFTAALFSDVAAETQANIFRQANEGRLKPRE